MGTSLFISTILAANAKGTNIGTPQCFRGSPQIQGPEIVTLRQNCAGRSRFKEHLRLGGGHGSKQNRCALLPGLRRPELAPCFHPY
jgi:hypothetical protein